MIKHDNRFTEQLNNFHNKVISYLRDTEVILIMVPGEAKTELTGKIKKSNLYGPIAGIEVADKMTDGQIAAEIRDYFHNQDRRHSSKTVTGHNMPNFKLSRRKTDKV